MILLVFIPGVLNNRQTKKDQKERLIIKWDNHSIM